jgi:hypothetical protein
MNHLTWILFLTFFCNAFSVTSLLWDRAEGQRRVAFVRLCILVVIDIALLLHTAHPASVLAVMSAGILAPVAWLRRDARRSA